MAYNPNNPTAWESYTRGIDALSKDTKAKTDLMNLFTARQGAQTSATNRSQDAAQDVRDVTTRVQGKTTREALVKPWETNGDLNRLKNIAVSGNFDNGGYKPTVQPVKGQVKNASTYMRDSGSVPAKGSAAPNLALAPDPDASNMIRQQEGIAGGSTPAPTSFNLANDSALPENLLDGMSKVSVNDPTIKWLRDMLGMGLDPRMMPDTGRGAVNPAQPLDAGADILEILLMGSGKAEETAKKLLEGNKTGAELWATGEKGRTNQLAGKVREDMANYFDPIYDDVVSSGGVLRDKDGRVIRDESTLGEVGALSRSELDAQDINQGLAGLNAGDTISAMGALRLGEGSPDLQRFMMAGAYGDVVGKAASMGAGLAEKGWMADMWRQGEQAGLDEQKNRSKDEINAVKTEQGRNIDRMEGEVGRRIDDVVKNAQYSPDDIKTVTSSIIGKVNPEQATSTLVNMIQNGVGAMPQFNVGSWGPEIEKEMKLVEAELSRARSNAKQGQKNSKFGNASAKTPHASDIKQAAATDAINRVILRKRKEAEGTIQNLQTMRKRLAQSGWLNPTQLAQIDGAIQNLNRIVNMTDKDRYFQQLKDSYGSSTGENPLTTISRSLGFPT